MITDNLERSVNLDLVSGVISHTFIYSTNIANSMSGLADQAGNKTEISLLVEHTFS